MNQEGISGLALTWKSICDQYTGTELQSTLSFIELHVDTLVEAFYKQMLLEPESAEFFSDDIIQKRLSDTLRAWILETFSVALNERFMPAIERQQLVGRVHARVGIPSWLIMRGVREIQRQVFELLAENANITTHRHISYFVQIMGFSTEVMCRSYEASTVEKQEVKHSYRLFSAMQDVAIQKDRQRSSLLDWENELMFKIFSGHLDFHHSALSKSEFGLWFIHKASYAFAGSEQVQLIIDRIYQVDELNQTILKAHYKTAIFDVVQKIRVLNREIQHLVDQLFQVAEYIESGNDTLTQLLNRRYLDTIIEREISYSRKNTVPLSLLAIDADYFKNINDRYGHAAGDLALKLIGEILQKNSKGSDYAFRTGGEEFLVLLVNTDLKAAQQVAENIRRSAERSVVKTPEGESFSFTLSIGCLQYNGHPDYQKFLDAADAALYVAKNEGRNCVYVENNVAQLTTTHSGLTKLESQA